MSRTISGSQVYNSPNLRSEPNNTTTTGLPKWQCHKIVEAFQIVDALADRDGLTLRGRAGLSVTVGADYVQRLPADVRAPIQL